MSIDRSSETTFRFRRSASRTPSRRRHRVQNAVVGRRPERLRTSAKSWMSRAFVHRLAAGIGKWLVQLPCPAGRPPQVGFFRGLRISLNGHGWHALHITAKRYPDLVVSCRFGRVPVFVVAVSLAGAVGSNAFVHAQSGPPVVVQPAAPGEPGRAATAKSGASPAVSPADVTFMQGMIGHHAQAIDMTALVDSHTTSKDMKLLAKRISVSQTDEIKSMQRWLEAHGQSVPSEHAHHMMMAEGHLMPGMLTGGDVAACCRQRRGVRSPVSAIHDQAPRRCARDGEGLVRESGCSPGCECLRTHPMWTPISAWKSAACARCWPQVTHETRGF